MAPQHYLSQDAEGIMTATADRKLTCRLEPKACRTTLPYSITSQREYSQAVWDTGGLPVLVPLIADPEYTRAELMGRLDGIVLSGSASDVDPVAYGEASGDPNLGTGGPGTKDCRRSMALTHLALETQ